MRRFGDALVQALHGMVRNGLLTFVSIFVLVSCLLFIGSFALISKIIDYNLEDITDLNEIEVFLEYDADAATAASIGDKIRALDNVESVTYVSKEEGLREIAGEFAEYAYLLDDITPEENPLSDCYRITYADNARATTLDYELKQIEDGMTLFTFGLAKKVLLADTIGALWTDIIGIADSPSTTFVGLANASTALVWLGVIAYSLQLYFDFSGYSMMGIGMGKMLGFDFPQNFNYPYISASITEFWRRWHMTLSGWFREYVYIPLGGNRKGLKRQIFNLFVVELLTGIWHGANWNFICWGLYYFVLLAIEKLFLLQYLQKGNVWPHIYTLFLVVVGWAMFVGNDAGVSFGLLFQKLFIPSGGVSPLYFLRNYGVLLIVSVICCTPLIEKFWNLLKKNGVTRCATILALLVVSTAYVVGSTNSPFLYFNF